MTKLVTGLALLPAAACASSPDSEACLAEPQMACVPDRGTDFATLHRDVISQRCGTAGGGCHGPVNTQGNLNLAEIDVAYGALLGQSGGAARVVPGDPGCSLLMQRLESDDPALRMPRGEGKLPEGMRCAVRRWIEEGAAR